MQLTEKCKKDFESWYLNTIGSLREDYLRFSDSSILRKFYREIDSMKYGVYLDFFISQGFYPNVIPLENDAEERVYQSYNDENHIETFTNMSLARRKAIEIVNKEYNKL